jgi:hypothetical protein
MNSIQENGGSSTLMVDTIQGAASLLSNQGIVEKAISYMAKNDNKCLFIALISTPPLLSTPVGLLITTPLIACAARTSCAEVALSLKAGGEFIAKHGIEMGCRALIKSISANRSAIKDILIISIPIFVLRGGIQIVLSALGQTLGRLLDSVYKAPFSTIPANNPKSSAPPSMR